MRSFFLFPYLPMIQALFSIFDFIADLKSDIKATIVFQCGKWHFASRIEHCKNEIQLNIESELNKNGIKKKIWKKTHRGERIMFRLRSQTLHLH